MKIDYYKQIPEVRVIDYNPVIEFYKGTLIAEYTLTGTITDIMYPAPVREKQVPVPGTKVLYRILGNGSDTPALFGFNPTTNSAGFNIGLGAVNLIEFLFDGEDYWFTIKSGLPAPDPVIIDKGLGSAVLSVTTKPYVVMPVQNVLGVPLARLTVKELLINIHYTGVLPLTYYIKPTGNPAPYNQNTDPLLAYWDFNCNDLGQQPISVYVSDGVLTSPVVDCSVLLQDNNGTCI